MISTSICRGMVNIVETASLFQMCRSGIQLPNAHLHFFSRCQQSTFSNSPILAYTVYEPAESSSPTSNFPLLITHGLLGSKQNWASIAKAVSRSTGRKVITFDARNHGDSPHMPVMDYHAMSDDVFNLASHLKIDKFSLLGHSMGGRTAMTFALKYPDMLEKLIIVDMSPDTLGADFKEMESYIRCLLSIIYKFSPKDLPLSMARKIADTALETVTKSKAVRDFLLTNLVRDADGVHWKPNLPILLKYLWQIGEFPQELKSKTFEKPALFIRGGKSPYVPDKEIEKIQRIFKKEEIATMENSGHWPHADNPREFVEILINFLNR